VSQSSGTNSADEQIDDEQIDDELDVAGRSAASDELWADVRIDPIEISLTRGVGYTLRAYRLDTELAAPEIDEADSDDRDDFDAASKAVLAGRKRSDRDEDDEDEDLDPEDFDDEEAALADEADLEDDDEDDEEDDEDKEPEEVPVFLAARGKVFLFETPEKLVEFVRSDAEHDLTQLDSWPTLVKRLQPADVVPAEDDRYELDLVVENLRGGPDVWEPTLIIRAGELARDLGYALRIEPILTALSAGSPLDDLDESLRSVTSGGVGAFFARRKLRKLGGQQTALGWRTIIGKISAAVHWRD